MYAENNVPIALLQSIQPPLSLPPPAVYDREAEVLLYIGSGSRVLEYLSVGFSNDQSTLRGLC